MVNDKIDYTLKFMDVVQQSNSVEFFNNSGNVDPNKFIAWWFNDYESIINSLQEAQNK
jgi:hypothetical protein